MTYTTLNLIELRKTIDNNALFESYIRNLKKCGVKIENDKDLVRHIASELGFKEDPVYTKLELTFNDKSNFYILIEFELSKRRLENIKETRNRLGDTWFELSYILRNNFNSSIHDMSKAFGMNVSVLANIAEGSVIVSDKTINLLKEKILSMNIKTPYPRTSRSSIVSEVDREVFRANLYKFLDSINLTKVEKARLVGLNVTTLRDALSGKTYLTNKSIDKIYHSLSENDKYSCFAKYFNKENPEKIKI